MAKLQKQSVGFTQVANKILCDKNLSAKAKWIYAYLYSKPDNWQFAAERIANDFSDGLWAIKKGLQELEKLGFLERKRQHNGSVEYFLYIDPKVENQTLDTDPKVDFRTERFPHWEEINLINNTDINTNTDLLNNTDVDWKISEKTKEKISEFISYRKEKKSKLTERSILAIIKKAEQYGEEKTIATIDRSIENGWQGLFWEKTEKSGNFFRKSARNALTEEKDYSTNRFAVWST